MSRRPKSTRDHRAEAIADLERRLEAAREFVRAVTAPRPALWNWARARRGQPSERRGDGRRKDALELALVAAATSAPLRPLARWAGIAAVTARRRLDMVADIRRADAIFAAAFDDAVAAIRKSSEQTSSVMPSRDSDDRAVEGAPR